jgi:hypothetical protein
MTTKSKAEKRTPRATDNGPDQGERAFLQERGFPPRLYVWREPESFAAEDAGNLLCDESLPETSDRPVAVYRLEYVGDLKVTRELKR